MTTADEPPKPTTFCLFQDGCRSMAIEVGFVIELIDFPRLGIPPLSPQPLVGLAAYRGEIIPVVTTNPSAWPDLDASTNQLGVLILRAARGLWGLAVDRQRVSVVEATPDEDIPESNLPPYIQPMAGITVSGSRLAVLNPEETWKTLRNWITRWYSEIVGDEVSSPIEPV